MFTYTLYGVTGILLILSLIKDRKKTMMALKKAWKSLENILPQLLTILLVISIMLSILNQETISRLLGAESGLLGMAIAAVIGSITLIPGFVAFPPGGLIAASRGGLRTDHYVHYHIDDGGRSHTAS